MEGVRLLPWLSAYMGAADKPDKPPPQEPYDCTECRQRTSQIERRGWWCGWEPAEAWPKERDVSPMLGDCEVSLDPSVCPGYSMRLPQAQEAARAYGHWQKGALEARYRQHGDVLEALWRLIEIYASEESRSVAWMRREARRK